MLEMAILKFNERPASGSASKDFARQVLWPECDTRTKARWEERAGSTAFPCDLHICAVVHVCVSSSMQTHRIKEDLVSQKSWLFNNPSGYFLVPMSVSEGVNMPCPNNIQSEQWPTQKHANTPCGIVHYYQGVCWYTFLIWADIISDWLM